VADSIRPPAANPRPAERPVQDEWGIFDPDQAGLAAVLRRIREQPRDPSPSERDRTNTLAE